MDERPLTIEEIAAAKAAYRRRRAALSWPEKIRIVVELQKRQAPILALRGIRQHVWNVSFADETPNANKTGSE